MRGGSVFAFLSRSFWTAALLVSAAGAATAQEIDYGSLEQLFGEPVTSSATGVPQRVTDVPVDMEILTADDIRRSGAKDIPGVLAHVNGIDVLPFGNANTDLAIGGYDQPASSRLLVLVNGRQAYLDHYGFTQWSAIPVQLEEIRQIEIIKGPNSALYGFNATGGVINIITYNPLYDSVKTAAIQGGTQNFIRGSAVVTGKIGNDFALKLSAGGHAGDDFARLQAIARGLGLRERNERGSLGVDAHWRLGADTTLEFEATHVAANQLDVAPAYQLTYSRYSVDSLLGRYTANTRLGLVEATAYTNFASQKIAPPALSKPLDIKNQVTVAQMQDVFRAGSSHTFRLSAEYRHNENNIVPENAGTISYDVAALSGAWTWNILPDLSLTQAARMDGLWLQRTGQVPADYPFTNAGFRRTLIEPSYNSGLVWRVTDEDVLRATAARGLQLPSLIQFGALLAKGVDNIGVSGNPSISPAVVKNYELQWERTLPALDSQIKTSVNYQNTNDIQNIATASFVIAPTGMPYVFADNIGRSREISLNLSLSGKSASGWRWGAGYSPRWIQDHFKLNQPSSATGVGFKQTTPVHLVNANIGWSSGAFEADLFGRFVSDSFGFTQPNGHYFGLTDIGAFFTLDARVGYQLTPAVTIALSGQNLTSDRQKQTSFGEVDRRVLGSLTVRY